MTETLTRQHAVWMDEDAYIVRSEAVASTSRLPQQSGTQSFSRTRGAMMPLLFGIAAFAGAGVPGVSRVFSGASGSRSVIRREDWSLWSEAFIYTEERAELSEVRALNALLNLPASTGLELDLPE